MSIGGQLWPRPTRGRGGGKGEPVLRSGPSASRPPDGPALSWRRATLFSARGRVPIRQSKGPFLCGNILVSLSPIQAFLTLQLPHPSRRGHFDQGRGQGCLELGHCPGRRTVLAPGFWSASWAAVKARGWGNLLQWLPVLLSVCCRDLRPDWDVSFTLLSFF